MSDDRFMDLILRFIEHLPDDKDETLQILKGHLLIEEVLHELIDKKLKRPEALKEARLEFFATVCLAEALYAHKAPAWLWVAVKKLNSIRNQYAHNLLPAGIKNKIADFLAFVEANRDKRNSLRELAKNTPLRLALGDIHTQLLILVS